jgi:hypothetical protein
MHWQQGGERKVEKSCIASLDPIPRVKGGLCFSFAFLAFRGCGLLYQVTLTDFGNRPDRFGETGLTGFGNRSDRFVPRAGICSGGVCIYAGELLYALVVCALCLSMVLSRMCRAVALV